MEEQTNQYPKVFDLGSSRPFYRVGLEDNVLRSSRVTSGTHGSILTYDGAEFQNCSEYLQHWVRKLITLFSTMDYC